MGEGWGSAGCDSRSFRRNSSDSRCKSERRLEHIYQMAYQLAQFGMCIPALVLPLEGVRDNAFRINFATSSTWLVWI